LRSPLRPSSALSPCEFPTCRRALIPSPVPACLCWRSRPSLALSPSEFESVYVRALTPTHVPGGFRQSGSWPLQPAWPITWLTTRVFRRPHLLPTPRVIEYSDEVLFLFHPPHLSYHLPAPLPHNSITIVILVSVWIRHKLASSTQFSSVSIMEMGNTWFRRCAFSFGFFVFLFLQTRVALGSGR